MQVTKSTIGSDNVGDVELKKLICLFKAGEKVLGLEAKKKVRR